MNVPRELCVCRLCLESDCVLRDIFEYREINDYQVIGLIQELLQLVVSKDRCFMSMVCESCIRKLKEFKDYKDHVKKCDNVLKMMFKGVERDTRTRLEINRRKPDNLDDDPCTTVVSCDEEDEEDDFRLILESDSEEDTEGRASGDGGSFQLVPIKSGEDDTGVASETVLSINCSEDIKDDPENLEALANKYVDTKSASPPTRLEYDVNINSIAIPKEEEGVRDLVLNEEDSVTYMGRSREWETQTLDENEGSTPSVIDPQGDECVKEEVHGPSLLADGSDLDTVNGIEEETPHNQQQPRGELSLNTREGAEKCDIAEVNGSNAHVNPRPSEASTSCEEPTLESSHPIEADKVGNGQEMTSTDNITKPIVVQELKMPSMSVLSKYREHSLEVTNLPCVTFHELLENVTVVPAGAVLERQMESNTNNQKNKDCSFRQEDSATNFEKSISSSGDIPMVDSLNPANKSSNQIAHTVKVNSGPDGHNTLSDGPDQEISSPSIGDDSGPHLSGSNKASNNILRRPTLVIVNSSRASLDSPQISMEVLKEVGKTVDLNQLSKPEGMRRVMEIGLQSVGTGLKKTSLSKKANEKRETSEQGNRRSGRVSMVPTKFNEYIIPQNILNVRSEDSTEDGLQGRRQRKHIQPLKESEISKSNWMKRGLISYRRNNEGIVIKVNSINTSVALKKVLTSGNGSNTQNNLDAKSERGSNWNKGEVVGDLPIGSFEGEHYSKMQGLQHNECGSASISKVLNSRHVIWHFSSVVFHCSICNMQFTEKKKLDSHNSVQHGRSVSKRRLQNEVLGEESGEFVGKRQLEIKQSSHSSESIDEGGDMGNDTNDRSRKFKSGVNNDIHSNREALSLNVETHSGIRHTCHICNKEFIKKKYQEIHIRNVHLQDWKFLCDICGRGFSYKSQLLNHINIHKIKSPYTCIYCQKGYLTAQCVKQHIQSVHKREKSYICGICPKRFAQTSDLRAHMLDHSNESPYVCDVCCKSFSQKGLWKQHMRRHSELKSYSCDICDRPFKYKSSILPHIATHFPEKPYSCDFCSKSFCAKSSLCKHRKIHLK